MQVDKQESYYYPLSNNDVSYGLIYSNPKTKTLHYSNNNNHIQYPLKKFETSFIPALKINSSNLNKFNNVKNLKIALPLTNENDRANFMEPDQNFEEYNNEPSQQVNYPFQMILFIIVVFQSLIYLSIKRNFKMDLKDR
jgi:hypothetical protein